MAVSDSRPVDALTTAYASNTRPRGADSAAPRATGWHPAIARLVARDHAFLPLVYDTPGCLFRGLDSGAAALLRSGRTALSDGAHALNALERELGVVLVSADVSDALSVARLWEHDGDACVLAFDAAYFAAEARAGRAAVLGFAEPGVVFRYPCLARPLPLSAVRLVCVSATVAPIDGEAIARVPAGCNSRERCTAFLTGALGERGLTAAVAARAPTVPGRGPPA